MTRQRPEMRPATPPGRRPVTSADYARLDTSYGRGRRTVTVLVLLAALAGGGYALLHRHGGHPSGEIPTVKADGPFKQKPESPGGIEIPHQDVQVYGQLDGNAGVGVEHLLPPAETPRNLPTTVTPQATGPGDIPTPVTPSPPTSSIDAIMAPAAAPPTASIDAATAVDGAPALPPAESPLPPPQQTAPPAPAPVPTPVPVPAPVNAAASPAPPAAVKTATHGATVIQLASVNDKAAAQTAMDQLQSRYQAALGPAELRLNRADLGPKGIYYRIQSQGMSEAQATEICNAVKAQHQGCLLVRP